jgi:ATP-binding cassette subfamily A (ABC1) protein 3
MILSAAKFNPDLDAQYRNFVPFSIDGSAEDSVPAKIQARFNNNPAEGVYGQAVPIVDLGGGDEFATCAQGPAVLNEVSQYLLKSVDDASMDGEKGSSRYGAVTVASTTNETNLNYNIMVNGSAIHGVGVFVNLVHQAFLQVVTGTPTATITARNYPLPETYKQKNDAATADAFVVALFAMIAFCFIPASFAVFVVKEREVKAKHQQVISGVSIYAYWTSTYFWDIVSYLPTAGLVILVVYIYDVKAYTTGSSGAAFALLLLLYGPATAAITYLISFIFVRCGGQLKSSYALNIA